METVLFFFPLTLKPLPLRHIFQLLFFFQREPLRLNDKQGVMYEVGEDVVFLALLFRTNFPKQSWRTAAVSTEWCLGCTNVYEHTRVALKRCADAFVMFSGVCCAVVDLLKWSHFSLWWDYLSELLDIVFPFQGVSGDWDWDCMYLYWKKSLHNTLTSEKAIHTQSERLRTRLVQDTSGKQEHNERSGISSGVMRDLKIETMIFLWYSITLCLKQHRPWQLWSTWYPFLSCWVVPPTLQFHWTVPHTY